jgi:hypothetical protein
MRVLTALFLLAFFVFAAIVSGQSATNPTATISQEQQIAQAEQSAIKALRAINAAQASFKSACAEGFYAPGLVELGLGPGGSAPGFITAALATGPSVTRDGYTITLESSEGPVSSSPESCSGLRAGTLWRGYHATAIPAPGSGGRYFGTNTTGIIFYGKSALKMTDQSSDGAPLQ